MNKLKIRTVGLALMTVLTVSAGVFSAFLYSNAISSMSNNIKTDGNGEFGGTLVVSNGNNDTKALTVAQGRVGFGTLAPQYALDVRGTISATQLRLANGFTLDQGGSNYAALGSWIDVKGIGLYSTTQNGSHFYPNQSVYGSWQILGARNGYSGINYNGKTVLMMQDDLIGLYNEYYGRWVIYGIGSTGNTYIAPNGGNVGIGTTNPAVSLQVAGSAVATGASIGKHGTHLNARFTCAGGITNIAGSSFKCNTPTARVYKGGGVYADERPIFYEPSPNTGLIAERVCWALGGSGMSSVDNAYDEEGVVGVINSFGGDVRTNNAPTYFYPITTTTHNLISAITCSF